MKTIALSALLFSLSIPVQYAQAQGEIIGRLVIPAIDLDTAIVVIPLDDSGTWDMSYAPHNVGWLDHTQWIEGNTPLAGHTPGIFSRINELTEGDEIFLYSEYEQEVFSYIVISNFYTVVPDLTVIYPNTNNELTLITCTDNPNTRRIVQAIRIA